MFIVVDILLIKGVLVGFEWDICDYLRVVLLVDFVVLLDDFLVMCRIEGVVLVKVIICEFDQLEKLIVDVKIIVDDCCDD